ncbi:TorF family putative porin [Alloalcanivorax mobilis]|uniref:TorF family putative porin n=1 Tax=Alloalcanivorax mobilis TaxID=2019569 RepID=UPI000B5B45BF|nr:TorF family putative porin [Alloalcanivorax mobilis]ASK33132.1 hypothetical protein CEK62_01395 [Alcanivorax sp. N3-2A]ASK36950.1 hypothetical protein CEK62_21590 [Alcanivorax sp. N3-2A]|tara:strand:+ start:4900 stop:5583 length:684 start_codon:yes stop_codon:yes gene_type:complete
MKKVLGLKHAVIAAAVAASVAPALASAEISGSLGMSSQYLWRGQSLFQGGTIFGSLDYAHASGLYAGAWTSSENDKTEYDLYAGFGGETDGGFSYDISYIDYNYSGPGNAACGGNDEDDCDFGEVHLGAGYAGFGADAYIGVGDYGHGAAQSDNKDNYYALSYTYDKITGAVGYYDFDDTSLQYTHVDLSYALTDQFAFGISKIVDQDTDDTYEDDLQFVVSYTFNL